MSLRVDLSISNHHWSLDSEKGTSQRSRVELMGQYGESQQGAEPTITVEELGEVAEHLGQAFEVIDRGLEFSVHEDTNRVMVKVINRETDEIIKEIPPEQLLDMVARIWDMIGLIVDEKA